MSQRTQWLFLKDLGPDRHDAGIADQRRRLAHWLGTLAATSTVFELTAGDVPVRLWGTTSPSCMTRSPDSRASPGRVRGRRRPRADLTRALGELAVTERRWPEIEGTVEACPPVIAHGDCVPKNIYVADSGAVVPVDWGSAGWGVPAADLGVATIRYGQPTQVAPQVETYVATLHAAVPDVTAELAMSLARLGRVLYMVKLLANSVPTFQHASQHKVGGLLGHYHAVLAQTVQSLGWR